MVRERVFWVAATDIIGNTGTAGFYSAIIVPPSSVKNLTSRELNGTTLIDWTPPSAGTMPIRRYSVYRGPVFSSATLVGRVDGSFMTLIEPNAGTYVYWVSPLDTAGNGGPETSTRVTVSQPNGFTLKYNQNLLVSNATTSNVATKTDGSGVVGPVDTAETWAQHFTNNGASTIQDLIDDGLVYFAEPADGEIGTAEWEIDLGAELRSASISTTYTIDELVGLPLLFLSSPGGNQRRMSGPGGSWFGDCKRV